jgi:putative ABC transport system substrate-binding protein
VNSLPNWITFFLSSFLFSCIFSQALAHGNNYKIAILAEPHHFELSNLIEETLYKSPNHKPRIMRFEPKAVLAQNQLSQFNQKFDLVLAIGPKSLRYIYESKPFDYALPIVSILTRPSELDKMLKDLPQRSGTVNNLIQLYLDQPVYRQLNLIRALCHESKCIGSIGIPLGPTSKSYRKELEKLAENNHVPINVVEINPDIHPVENMHHLLKESMMLLAIPDETIFNSRTGRGLLLSSYHNKTPIIGYSKTYVNHGALAAVYTSPTQLAEETSLLMLDALSYPLPFAQKGVYSKEFSVAVNPQVAKSMGFSLKTDSEIKHHILSLETKDHPHG